MCSLPTCLWLAATNPIQIGIWSGAENNCSAGKHAAAVMGFQQCAQCIEVLSTGISAHTCAEQLPNQMISVPQLIDSAICASLARCEEPVKLSILSHTDVLTECCALPSGLIGSLVS